MHEFMKTKKIFLRNHRSSDCTTGVCWRKSKIKFMKSFQQVMSLELQEGVSTSSWGLNPMNTPRTKIKIKISSLFTSNLKHIQLN